MRGKRSLVLARFPFLPHIGFIETAPSGQQLKAKPMKTRTKPFVSPSDREIEMGSIAHDAVFATFTKCKSEEEIRAMVTDVLRVAVMYMVDFADKSPAQVGTIARQFAKEHIEG